MYPTQEQGARCPPLGTALGEGWGRAFLERGALQSRAGHGSTHLLVPILFLVLGPGVLHVGPHVVFTASQRGPSTLIPALQTGELRPNDWPKATEQEVEPRQPYSEPVPCPTPGLWTRGQAG